MTMACSHPKVCLELAYRFRASFLAHLRSRQSVPQGLPDDPFGAEWLTKRPFDNNERGFQRKPSWSEERDQRGQCLRGLRLSNKLVCSVGR